MPISEIADRSGRDPPTIYRDVIHCDLDDPRRDQRVLGQTRDQGLGSPTPKECVLRQALAAPGPGTQAGQVPRHCRLFKDDKAFRHGLNDRKPMAEPVGALLSSLGAATLGGDQRLFCM